MDMTPTPLSLEIARLEQEIVNESFPIATRAAIRSLLNSLSILGQTTSTRYYPDREITEDDSYSIDRILAKETRTVWKRIGFHGRLDHEQRSLLLELLAQHGAMLEKDWLLTPKGRLRIDHDPEIV